MSSKAADRIHSMLEKGILTPEQAAELQKALEGQDEAPGTSEPSGGPSAAGDSAADSAWDNDDWGKHGGRRHRHPPFLPKEFLDMGWVNDMVDGITGGLGVRTDAGSRSSGNGQSSSRVEQPEGEGYEFRGNRVVYSRLSGMRMVRSKIKDNSFSASTFKDADLVDSSIEDCSLAGASLHELRMEKSDLKDVYLSGSKVNRLTLQGSTSMKGMRISGSRVNGMILLDGSRIRDTRFSGTAVSSLTLSRAAQMKDLRLTGATVSHLTMEASSLTNVRAQGCVLDGSRIADSELADTDFRGTRLRAAEISASRFKDCRFEAIAFDRLRVINSSLRKVVFRDSNFKMYGPLRAQAENLSIIDSDLDEVDFSDCVIHYTTIQGIKAHGIRLRGVDLSGTTITRAEDLEALVRR